MTIIAKKPYSPGPHPFFEKKNHISPVTIHFSGKKIVYHRLPSIYSVKKSYITGYHPFSQNKNRIVPVLYNLYFLKIIYTK